MMRLLLPLIMGILGIAIGGAAGWFLRPGTEPSAESCVKDCSPAEADSATATPNPSETPPATATSSEFVKLNNQFIVPDIQDGVVSSLIVLSLSIEVAAGQTEKVYTLEPKLRDLLLQVLFDHANAGGFLGDFTAAGRMEDLKRALLEASRAVLGDGVRNVLISDIVRQDMA